MCGACTCAQPRIPARFLHCVRYRVRLPARQHAGMMVPEQDERTGATTMTKFQVQWIMTNAGEDEVIRTVEVEAENPQQAAEVGRDVIGAVMGSLLVIPAMDGQARSRWRIVGRTIRPSSLPA